jgi:hypothetical protein
MKMKMWRRGFDELEDGGSKIIELVVVVFKAIRFFLVRRYHSA